MRLLLPLVLFLGACSSRGCAPEGMAEARRSAVGRSNGAPGGDMASADYATTILADSPGHFWRLKEGSTTVGSSFPDAAGGGVTADITTSNAIAGAAIVTTETGSFDNDSNSYLTLSATVTFAGDFTIEGWIRPSGGPYTTAGYKTILFASTSGNDGIDGQNDQWQAAVGGSAIITDAASISYPATYYLAWTRSGATNTLYKGASGSFASVGTASNSASVPMNFLGYVGCCGVNPFRLSDVATWTSALSSGALSAHYDAGK